MQFYYKKSHPTYKTLPLFRDDCKNSLESSMEFIYPKNGNRISLAKNFEGKTNELVLKLAHAKPETAVYWYLDEKFIDETSNFHELGIVPTIGKHKITAVDALGNEAIITIQIE